VKQKGKVAKGGFKVGRRRAARTRTGTAVMFGRALIGNERAREELRDAYSSARKAYRRGSDRRGRPDLAALLQDRKAQREAGNAAASVRSALQIANRSREKPSSRKGPAIAAVAVAGASAVALNKNLRAKALAPFSSGANGAAAADEGVAPAT
jgi:hypothetical protein